MIRVSNEKVAHILQQVMVEIHPQNPIQLQKVKKAMPCTNNPQNVQRHEAQILTYWPTATLNSIKSNFHYQKCPTEEQFSFVW